MIRRPPRSTRTDTLFPYTTLFRSSPFSSIHTSAITCPRLASFSLDTRQPPFDRGPTLNASASDAATDPSVATSPNHVSCNLLKRRVYRSEEHTSELQSLMRITYAVFCLKKKQCMTERKNKRITSTHLSV